MPELLNLVLRPPELLGRRCRTSAIDDRPVLAMAAWSTVMTGEGLSSGSRRMRDPVTTTSAESAVSMVEGSSVGACCAAAGVATIAKVSASSPQLAWIAFLVDRISGPLCRASVRANANMRRCGEAGNRPLAGRNQMLRRRDKTATAGGVASVGANMIASCA
ncbi:MAG: hypothetical protein ABWY10_06740 [Tardiphaga sp.]